MGDPVKLPPIRYSRLNSFFADYIRNISKGETFIATPKPLPEGTVFLFEIAFPGRDEPLLLKGKVAWRRLPGNPEGLDPGMGIAYVFDDLEDQIKLMQYVEGLMSAQFGSLLTRSLLRLPRRDEPPR